MLAEKVIIVFGMGPAGLFLARQLNKENKIVYGIGKTDDIGRYSNVLKGYYATETIEGVEEAINEIYRKVNLSIGGYICSDQYLTMFLEKNPSLFKSIDMSEPGAEVFELIFDKEKLINYCKKIDVQFPATYSEKDIDSNSVDYPIAAKPNIKRGHSPLKKITVIYNQKELTSFLDEAKNAGYKVEEILFQKYINGDNQWEYGYGGYFKDGMPITEVFFVQARQYPQGVSCYTIEIVDDVLRNEIRNATARFLREIKYTGFLQFDLKQDELTRQIYVLDINPRPWGSIAILTPKCVDASVFREKKDTGKRCCWHFPLKEAVSFCNKKNVSYKECRKIGCGISVIDLFDKKDVKPFFAQPIIAIKKIAIKVCIKKGIR